MMLYSLPSKVIQSMTEDDKDKLIDMLENMSVNSALLVNSESHYCFEPRLTRFIDEMGLREKFEAWLRLQKEDVEQ